MAPDLEDEEGVAADTSGAAQAVISPALLTLDEKPRPPPSAPESAEPETRRSATYQAKPASERDGKVGGAGGGPAALSLETQHEPRPSMDAPGKRQQGVGWKDSRGRDVFLGCWV